ncbi:transaldolase [Duganella sp. FT80W]|uniref:Transaldolase n=1 Tax=Duganella guangzhouensis TaxID=2666084 RepID=A0A6I2L141_9BURK|nr:transaldolase [Duganella guangzhouensis]MRW91562.1 transaldolase [Duganella guangzhouensis]
MNNMLEHSRLQAVGRLGQQIWLDNLSRDLLASGRLAELIAEDGVQGLTSNPAIFYQAIQHDPAYQAALPLLRTAHATPEARFEALVIPDVQRACDLFAPLYRDSDGRAGFVSFEVSPRLAHDADATVAEAKRLWTLIARPNLMIKIPATTAGIAALEQVIYAGINVNMTLIFAASQIQAVRAAHRRGLARRLQDKLSVQRIASVASVFISRIDVAVDALLPDGDPLRGQAAMAAARIAYADWQQDSGFGVFAAFGATPQWLLWASTATKTAAERDVRYVEGLIGADTINTVPDATLAAFRAHGVAETTLTRQVEGERALLAQLAHRGIDLETIGEQLLAAGLLQFEQAFSKLLALTE